MTKYRIVYKVKAPGLSWHVIGDCQFQTSRNVSSSVAGLPTDGCWQDTTGPIKCTFIR